MKSLGVVTTRKESRRPNQAGVHFLRGWNIALRGECISQAFGGARDAVLGFSVGFDIDRFAVRLLGSLKVAEGSESLTKVVVEEAEMGPLASRDREINSSLVCSHCSARIVSAPSHVAKAPKHFG